MGGRWFEVLSGLGLSWVHCCVVYGGWCGVVWCGGGEVEMLRRFCGG